MGQRAARVLDPCQPGGIVATGALTVLIGGQLAARVGDMCGSIASPTIPIVQGEPTVLICGSIAAREGDATGNGTISIGCPTVEIGSKAQGGCNIEAAQTGAAFVGESGE